MHVSSAIFWALSAAAIALSCAAALLTSIIRLVRTLRNALEATVALTPTMRVELPSAGPKVVYIKAPRFTSLRKLALTLHDARGNPVALQRILIPLQWNGQDVRVSYARCQVPSAGTYTLEASDIPEASRPLSVLFGRPNAIQAIAWILSIVLSASGMIASLVLSILFLSQ